MDNKEILILGGTGSLGKVLTRKIIEYKKYRGIRIYSRDEYKHWVMKQEFDSDERISYLIGDIQDRKRLELAMRDVDIVINCAAMKQVPICEENPMEAVKTNIEGAMNIVQCAIAHDVEKVMHISTDKAVYPVNLYGMTKGAAEKIFIHSNVYSPHYTSYSVCRYGNVLGSRGSLVPLILKQKETGIVNITDKRMSRFWITLNEVATFIINKTEEMQGGEIFIPKMPSMRIIDMIEVLAPDCEIREIGIRDGEKIHECLVTYEESVNCNIKETYMLINKDYKSNLRWSYCSNNNDKFLTKKELLEILKKAKVYNI